MLLKKVFSKSLDFWIVFSIVVISLSYIFVSEIFPSDWVLPKKCYRNQNKFFYLESFKKRVIACKKNCYFTLDPYIETPESLFKETHYLYVDDHFRTKVALVTIQDKLYVVKKYKCPNLWAWLRWIPLRSSKAFRSWHFANLLVELNIPTAQPVLMIENKWGPFWTTCYFVQNYVQGVRAADFFSMDSPHQPEWKQTLESFKYYLEKLNEHQLIHGKLSLTNTIVYDHTPYFLDLDLMHQYKLRHPFYLKRYENQHLARLKRKFSQLNPEAEKLYSDILH